MTRLVTLAAALLLAASGAGDLARPPAAGATTPRQVTAAASSTARPTLPVIVETARQLSGGPVVSVPQGILVAVIVRAVRAGDRVLLQRRADSSWATLAVARARRAGTARLLLPTGTPGSATYRVVATSRAEGPSRASRPIALTVTPAAEAPAPAPSAYTLLDPGRPGAVFRWDPCTPVRVRVQAEPGYPTLRADVAAALGRLAAATGLRFTDLGPTANGGAAADPGGFPADTDLVVTVAGEGEAPALAGGPVGYTTLNHSVWAGPDARILAAEVVLEREFLTSGSSAVGQLLLHELGHAVGLGHTADADQVMFPSVTGTASGYQPGDLAGLARVGSAAGCLS